MSFFNFVSHLPIDDPRIKYIYLKMEDQVDQSCFIPEIDLSFQKNYFYYTNFISPFTMLLSVWCCVSNAAVIVALLRTGVKSIRPGLLMLCSLTLTDFFWGAIVGPMNSSFRIKHLLNSQVCEVYSELEETPIIALLAISCSGTLLNLAVISIDRYFAVTKFVQYKFVVTWPRTLVTCCVVWLTSIAFGPLQSRFRLPIVCCLILTAFIVISVQVMTLLHLHHHNNNVAVIMQEGSQANPINTVNAAFERKLAKTTAYVVGALALVIIPGACSIIMTVITRKPYMKLSTSVIFPLMTLCSSINPILYYRKNQIVKQKICKLLKCQ